MKIWQRGEKEQVAVEGDLDAPFLSSPCLQLTTVSEIPSRLSQPRLDSSQALFTFVCNSGSQGQQLLAAPSTERRKRRVPSSSLRPISTQAWVCKARDRGYPSTNIVSTCFDADPAKDDENGDVQLSSLSSPPSSFLSFASLYR